MLEGEERAELQDFKERSGVHDALYSREWTGAWGGGDHFGGNHHVWNRDNQAEYIKAEHFSYSFSYTSIERQLEV